MYSPIYMHTIFQSTALLAYSNSMSEQEVDSSHGPGSMSQFGIEAVGSHRAGARPELLLVKRKPIIPSS